MTANEYQVLAARTINKNLTPLGATQHALFGMASEVGELHGIFQKKLQHGNDLMLSSDTVNVMYYDGTVKQIENQYVTEHAKKEVGDILWMIAEFCTVNDWDLEDIMQMNIDKLKARYPDGFSVEKSLHRKEGDI